MKLCSNFIIRDTIFWVDTLLDEKCLQLYDGLSHDEAYLFSLLASPRTETDREHN